MPVQSHRPPYPRRASTPSIVAAAITLASAWACGEAREVDVSAYERPPGATTDAAGAEDTSRAPRTARDEPRSDRGLPEALDRPADGGRTDGSGAEGGLGAAGRNGTAGERDRAGGNGPAEEDPREDDGDRADSEPPGATDPTAPHAGGASETADPAGDDIPAPTTQAVDVDRLLRVADEAYAGLPSLRARFHQVIEVPLLERRREGHGTWYQKGRSRFKMDFADPPEDEIVADGTYLWLYYPSTNPRQVIRSRLGTSGTGSGTADVLARILEEARTNYEGRHVGSETVDDVTTHVVSLRPTTRSPYRLVRVWIGTRDHLVRKFEITEENETVRTVTLTALEPGAALPDSLFRFVPPDDADVFEG